MYCTKKNMLFTSSAYIFPPVFTLPFIPPLHHLNEHFLNLSFCFNMQCVCFFSFMCSLSSPFYWISTRMFSHSFYFISFLLSIPLQWRVFIHLIFCIVLAGFTQHFMCTFILILQGFSFVCGFFYSLILNKLFYLKFCVRVLQTIDAGLNELGNGSCIE